MRIVISSYEMVTPLGENVEKSFSNAVAGKSGIVKISRFNSDDIDIHYGGEVPDINFLEYNIFNARNLKNWFSPVIPHSMHVAYRAMKKSGLSITDKNRHKIGVIFSSALGGTDAILEADQNLNQNGTMPHPFTNLNYCLNLIAGKISILLKTTGPSFSPVAACATGNVSVTLASLLIRQGLIDVAVCGAVDFPLIKALTAAFATMNAAFCVEDENDRGYHFPGKASRPFSIDRKGFVLAEGAACLIITSLDYAIKNNMNIEAEIKGTAMNSDGSHYVLPKSETAAECIENALSEAQIGRDDIDHINAHAASTKVGDLSEISAIKTVFGNGFQIPICANKSQIGHSMGASSAIELIFSLLSLKNGVIFPTINYSSDPELKLNNNLFNSAYEKKINTVLNNSFGFGGTNCCVILGKV